MIRRFLLIGFLALGVTWACAFDVTLREYLSIGFWLPFAKHVKTYARKDVKRGDAPYAGMVEVSDGAPLSRLRAAYQTIATPDAPVLHLDDVRRALDLARAARGLTAKEQEEIRLIDAKIDMRAGGNAEKKFQNFLGTAQTSEYLSEARGWLAHIYYERGDQTAAGKIYLDELNRSGSNLSTETLVTSLRLTYGYDGGPELLEHLGDYFDTPEHARFAIELSTNPNWDRGSYWQQEPASVVTEPPPYERIKALLAAHKDLLQSETGAGLLALLGMRTALRAGDPAAALSIAAAVPRSSSTHADPDFDWMLASAHFLSRDYPGAEKPLLHLFASRDASETQRAAAAYSLCGVYQKIKNPVEQIRYALWLHEHGNNEQNDSSVYWAVSGWDFALLMDCESSIQALRSFIARYPRAANVALVKYSLAVRLARANRYAESAQIYEALQVRGRAARMRRLALLSAGAREGDSGARYAVAEFLSANEEKIYFNDRLWNGLQRYALFSLRDSRLTREERTTLVKGERKLKDDQEERWRAYLILRDVVARSGHTELGKRAALLALHCLRGINERFERKEEIRAADVSLSLWLRRS